MGIAFVLYGAKGAGKTYLARWLHAELGADHVDPDPLIQALLDSGVKPHPTSGWLPQVLHACFAALQRNGRISVEATGAWDTDWRLPDDLARRGDEVIRVWVYAPLDVTLERLAASRPGRAPVPPEEAQRIHELASRHAQGVDFDVVLETTSRAAAETAVEQLRELLARDARRPDPEA